MFLCGIVHAQNGFIGNGMVGGENPNFYGNKTINATLGAELLTWTATSWTPITVTWTMTTTGPLTHVTGNTTAVTGTITGALTVGATYAVHITGTGGGDTATYTVGGLTGTTIAATGAIDFTDHITAISNTELVITPTSTCTVALTLVSVKLLTNATGDLTVDGNLTVRSPAVFWGQQVRVPEGSVQAGSSPGLAFGLYTDTGLSANGSNLCFWESGTIALNLADIIKEFRVPSDYKFSFSSTPENNSGSDTLFLRDAANTPAFRNSTNQQKVNIYNTAASATADYERLAVTGVQGASLNLTAETNGTGADNLDIVLTPAGTGRVTTVLSDNNAGNVITINALQAAVTAADTFMDFRSTTGSEATIAGTAVAGVVAYNTFTGSHYTKIVNKPETIPIGTVLEMTGNLIGEWPDKSYIETIDVVKDVPFMVKSADKVGNLIKKPLLDVDGNPETYQITEKKDILHDLKTAPKQYLTESRICVTKGSKSVYGVYGGTDKEGRDTVLALGTGVILVVNTGKNIEAGDFLISSATKGHAELQGDDFYRNSTIAKATQNVIWKAGEISRLIACIYLGG